VNCPPLPISLSFWVELVGACNSIEIYYEPAEVKAAIVTCGGLCPGLNDVIRQVLIFKKCPDISAFQTQNS